MSNPDVRICFVGDSYVQGTGDPDCLGWAGCLCVAARQAGHHLTGYNLGVRRETSADIARRWLAECAPRLPATTQNTVVFSFGANDVTIENGAPRVAETETLRNLRTLLDAATARYQTLLIGPPATADAAHNARLGQLSQRMGEIAAQTAVPYLALFPLLVNDASWLAEVSANDGAHPRAAGYAKIAALIGSWTAWRYR